MSGQLTNTKNVDAGGTCAELEITDKKNLTNTKAFTATDATYTRTMNSQYGTLILPFAIDVESSSANFYTLRSVVLGDDAYMSFAEVTGTTIAANTPLLVEKTLSDGITIKGTNAAVVTIDETTTTQQAGWNAIGYYQNNPELDGTGIYYIAAGMFWCGDNLGDDPKLNMYAFRTVFSQTNTPSHVKSFSIRIVDPTTGVETLNTNNRLRGDVYTIDGRLIRLQEQGVDGLKPGLYMIGGKKVSVK